MKAVVTGATGCIGSVLCRELMAGGWKVRALVRPGREYGHIAGHVSETHTGNIMALESLARLADSADVVFHSHWPGAWAMSWKNCARPWACARPSHVWPPA